MLFRQPYKKPNPMKNSYLARKKPRDKADVYKTYGANKKIRNFFGKKIKFTNYKIGIKKTCEWYNQNYKIL